MPSVGYGSIASRWAGAVGLSEPLIVAEPEFAAQAVELAYKWRLAGMNFIASVVFADQVARRFEPWYGERFGPKPPVDEWRFILESARLRTVAIDGQLLRLDFPVDPTTIEKLQLFIALGSGLLARSRSESTRLQGLVGAFGRPIEIALAEDRMVPPPTASHVRERIVVWAPFTPGIALLPYVSVLAELGIPATLVCARSSIAAPGIEFVNISAAASALARARVVVDATLGDPASAVALARWERPLCVPHTNGADEFVDGLRLFDPTNRESINTAIQDALGVAAATVRAPLPSLPTMALRDTASASTPLPLVSVVVATYNRRLQLAEALSSIAAQSYDNYEVIVVNDGGAPVDDLVAAHPRARLIASERNGGPFTATNIGIEAARGEWITWLDDDDLWFSDHLERMVAVGMRSGEAVVAGQAVFRYTRTGDEGAQAIVDLVRSTIAMHDRSLMAAQCMIVSPALLVHRRAFDAAGRFDPSFVRANDFEFYLRLGRAVPFARCDAITSVYTATLDQRNRSHERPLEFVAGHQAIYEKHAIGGDRFIARAREATLEMLRERAKP